MKAENLSYLIARRLRTIALLGAAAICGPVTTAFAQDALDAIPYTVRVSAEAVLDGSQWKIRLTWPRAADTTGGYRIYRKLKTGTSWGSPLNSTPLAGDAESYDNNVTQGAAWEYQVVKTTSGNAFRAYGYVYAGANAPPVNHATQNHRGRVLLLVDNTFSAPLAAELSRLEEDLRGDGWTVVRENVNRAEEIYPAGNPVEAAAVRSTIQTYFNQSASLASVLLFGRIPIRRSGNLDPDEHGARPFPADVFYGEMNATAATWNANPSFLPSDVDVPVGRVDLSDLDDLADFGNDFVDPTHSEVELLRQYLNKNHDFRHKKGVFASIQPRGLIASTWGLLPGNEPIAAGAYRTFAPFFGSGDEDIVVRRADATMPDNERWISELESGTYLWAYGAGGGDHDSVAQLGLTQGEYEKRLFSNEVYYKDPRAVFTMLFGSHFLEWDYPDDDYQGNLMRAMLAAPNYVLTCSWSARPQNIYHHMGLGETVGYGIRVTQNNRANGNAATLYSNHVNSASWARGIHIALMGDPTLRMHPVAPPSFMPGSVSTQDGVTINWITSTDSQIQGYHVYRSNTTTRVFDRITTHAKLPSDISHTDPVVKSGSAIYMVRAVKLETSASGSYSNLSQGMIVAMSFDLPNVSIRATDPNASETGSNSGEFTVHRTGATTSPLTVHYSISGSAVNGSDYNTLSGQVTIPSGAASVPITITPVYDAFYEDNEVVTLTLQPQATYNMSHWRATVTIAPSVPVFTDLGTLSGGSYAYAYGINQNSEVTGYGLSNLGVPGWHAFRWANGVMTDIAASYYSGEVYGYAIGDNSMIVGTYSDIDGLWPFKWTQGSGLGLLGPLSGTSEAWAMAVNSSGAIVGYGTNGSVARAVRWDAGSLIPTDLSAGTPGIYSSHAYGINSDGYIVGQWSTTGFILAPGNLLAQSTSLGTPYGGGQSVAFALNASRQVVGSATGPTAWRAFVKAADTPTGQGFTILGPVWNTTNSTAYAINSHGQVVGQSDNTGFLWQSGKMMDLRRITGQPIIIARGINNAGKIVGTYGANRAFILSPGP
jgi:probable HAF family extracellular repeat protein